MPDKQNAFAADRKCGTGRRKLKSFLRTEDKLIDDDYVDFQDPKMEELFDDDYSVDLQSPHNFTFICDNDVYDLGKSNLGD